MSVRRGVIALVGAILALSVCSLEHHCIHDELWESHKEEFGKRRTVSPQIYKELNLPLHHVPKHGLHTRDIFSDHVNISNIRILLDFSFFGAADDRTCLVENNYVKIGNPVGSVTGTNTCSGSLTQNCWMKCTADTSTTSGNIYTSAKGEYMRNRTMAAAKTFLTEALSVVPVAGMLTLAADASTSCGFNGGVTIPNDPYFTTGVAYDLVLFVTARPTTGAVIAYAGSCQTDSRGRPIFGQVNFGPNKVPLPASYDSDFKMYFGVAIHEISHALGFQGYMFSQYVVSINSTEKYPTGTATGTITLTQPVSNQRSVLKTPRALQKAREHFGCATMDGIEIEDSGGSGTSGSHWEKRIFMDEYMTGSSSTVPYISAITLALFEDSGWYVANYTKAQRFDWGRDQGCAFVSNDCGSWANNFQCTDGASVCSYNAAAKGYCQYETYDSDLPTQYRHVASSTKKGGYSDLADFCPLVRSYSNGACDSESSSTPDSTAQGEKFASDSKCFTATLNKRTDSALSFSGSSSTATAARQSCYRAVCQSATGPLMVQVGGVEWQPCTTTGAAIEFSGYDGTVTCPNVTWHCAGSATYLWPTFVSIDQTTLAGAGGQTVTITGTQMDKVSSITVGFHACTNLIKVTNATATCVVASHSDLDSTSKGSVCLLMSSGYGSCGKDAVTIDVSSALLKSAQETAAAAAAWARAFFVVNWFWVIPSFFALVDLIVVIYCRKQVNKLMQVQPMDEKGGNPRSGATLRDSD